MLRRELLLCLKNFFFGIASQILSNESIYSDNILDAKPNLDYSEKMISECKNTEWFFKV